ncbi:rhodanese-like domain-containing protein [Arcobacter sp.]|uniref:rhodanese-like domain-containing protein n=1 Tax=unclassified Arcobacter TaxID=2593671 RepID=UPI003B005297
MNNTLKNVLPKDIEPFINKNTPIIDIRREDEFKATGIIKGAYKLTFFNEYGQHDLDTWLKEFKKIVKNKSENFILVCAHANRTKVVGDFLANKLSYENAYHLEGGMALWLAQNKEVTF